jgi:hypothetical protein
MTYNSPSLRSFLLSSSYHINPLFLDSEHAALLLVFIMLVFNLNVPYPSEVNMEPRSSHPLSLILAKRNGTAQLVEQLSSPFSVRMVI